MSFPEIDEEDILEDDGGAPAGGRLEPDLDDTQADTQQQYVYVQHPLTKRVSRRRNEEVLRDRERTAGQREELGARAQTDSVGEAMEAIDHVTATAFLFCQSIYAGVALLALVMSAASDDFVAYYSPLASVCRKVTMFLGSLCILAAVEKHGRGGAVGWAGGGWLRSVAVMSLYSLSFLLTLLNTPMDDLLTWTHQRVPAWYSLSDPSEKFESDMDLWHVFNLLRLLFAIAAWAVLSSDERTQPAQAVINYEAEHKETAFRNHRAWWCCDRSGSRNGAG